MATYNDALFRQQFPEFADTTVYPEAVLSMYWDMAANFIDPTDPTAVADSSLPCSCYCALQRLLLTDSSLALALNFLTAHLLTIATPVPKAGVAANPTQGGFETSASIGDISVSKLAPPMKDAWDYWLLQSPYGQSLSALLSVASVGGLSVGCMPERQGFRKYGGVFF